MTRLVKLVAPLAFVVAVLLGDCLQAQFYERPVETAPQADDIGGGYVVPPVQRPLPRADWLEYLDVAVLAVMMAVVAWIVLRRRSRNLLVFVSIGCLVYFGFYREGCVCPIGAIQNVAVALTDPHYAIPRVVIALFFLPLAMSLLFGRVFCGGVCALGAIQDLVVVRPLHLPRLLDKLLGTFKYVYLVWAIWFAIQPAAERDFVICRFDPFVGLFRLTGPGHMLILGGGFLLLGLFIGRPYCRFLCPYGALLSLLSRFAWRSVTITPDDELDCGLCARACPFGAIEKMRAESSSCVSCARCYRSCPKQSAQQGEIGVIETVASPSAAKGAIESKMES